MGIDRVKPKPEVPLAFGLGAMDVREDVDVDGTPRSTEDVETEFEVGTEPDAKEDADTEVFGIDGLPLGVPDKDNDGGRGERDELRAGPECVCIGILPVMVTYGLQVKTVLLWV